MEPLDIDHVLHGGQELHVAAADRVAEEAVDLRPAPLREAVDHAQRVVLHPAAAEELHRAHDAGESGPAALRQAECVVYILGAVEREPHQKVVGGEELAPPLVDQRAVGLQRVLDALAAGVFALQLHRPGVEVDAQQQGSPRRQQNCTVGTSLASMYCRT